jgi:hypothetical protein
LNARVGVDENFPFLPELGLLLPYLSPSQKRPRSFRAQRHRRAPEESSVARDGTAAAFEEERRNKLGSFCKQVAHLIIIFYYFVAFLLLSFELVICILWLCFSVFSFFLSFGFVGSCYLASFLALFIGCCFFSSRKFCVPDFGRLIGGFFFFSRSSLVLLLMS